MNNTLRWETEDGPGGDAAMAVDNGLDQFNHAAADLDAIYRFGCYVRDAAGVLVGGAVGRYWGTACELQQIWVDESHRQAGIGSRLVHMFEEHALRCGCTLVYLDTFTFQAPAFYFKLGYTVACELPGFPGGASKFILRKQIGGEGDDIPGTPA